MEKNCLNCDAVLMEDPRFCPECGQKTQLCRLTAREIFSEVLHFFTHADKSFLNLLKALVVKNGLVAREYITGKRRRYFPPLNFFLLAATIFVFIATLSNPRRVTLADVLRTHPEINHIPDKAQKEHVTAMYLRGGEVTAFMGKYSNIVAMIAIPLICLIYWAFYSRGIYSYADHLVACFYMLGFGNLVYAIIFVPLTMAFGRNMVFVFFLLQVIYNSVYYYHFINTRTKTALFKAVGVSFFAIASWATLTSFLIGWYIKKG